MKFKTKPKIGFGFLVEMKKPRKRGEPRFRGLLKLPRDYKKGHSLVIVAWTKRAKNGGIYLKLQINTQELRRSFILKHIEERKQKREYQAKMISENAEYQKGLWPPKDKPKPYVPVAPRELKRSDVL